MVADGVSLFDQTRPDPSGSPMSVHLSFRSRSQLIAHPHRRYHACGYRKLRPELKMRFRSVREINPVQQVARACNIVTSLLATLNFQGARVLATDRQSQDLQNAHQNRLPLQDTADCSDARIPHTPLTRWLAQTGTLPWTVWLVSPSGSVRRLVENAIFSRIVAARRI